MAIDMNAEFATISSSGTKDPEALGMPYLRTVSNIRDELRKLATSSPAKKQILSLSDRIRDVDRTLLGVYLDDRSDDQGALIKFIPKEELMAQKEEKAAKEREKAAAKEAQRLAREGKKSKLRRKRRKSAPWICSEMMRGLVLGMKRACPPRRRRESDVPKSALKKLRKEWDRQKKAHRKNGRQRVVHRSSSGLAGVKEVKLGNISICRFIYSFVSKIPHRFPLISSSVTFPPRPSLMLALVVF